jgi:integrase
MARPSKSAEVDTSKPQELTVGLIERLRCPVDRSQAFLRDTKAPALRVRVTPARAKSFVFEAKLNRQTVRCTIGDVRSWSIDAARAEANRLRVLVDSGTDPRELERQQTADRDARKAQDSAETVTVQEAWDAYLAARKARWGARHYADHVAKAKAGGVKAKRGTRGTGETIAGPLHPLMAIKLRDLSPAIIGAWAAEQAGRPTAARLAWRLLKGFLSWCAEQSAYASVLPAQNPAKGKAVREVLGKSKVKQDSLQREQLAPWFAAVRQLPNATAAAYLQTLLLTGARPGEVLAIRWEDLNTKWKGLTIRDKVEGERVIPLTPYVAHLLAPLPRVNQWVFASPSRAPEFADKRISIPRNPHGTACRVAGIEGLSLHGLRRSFKSLTEWQEIPAGVVAQLMGHKPSATAEKHYTVRPLDLLRVHHERIEAWILDQAGIVFDAKTEPAALRVVAAR